MAKIQKFLYNKGKRKEELEDNSMRTLLKIVAFPFMIIFRLIFLLGIALVKVSAYISSPILTILGIFSILCVIEKNWSNLIIFAALAVLILVLTFGSTWLLCFFDDASDWLSDFIHS